MFQVILIILLFHTFDLCSFLIDSYTTDPSVKPTLLLRNGLLLVLFAVVICFFPQSVIIFNSLLNRCKVSFRLLVHCLVFRHVFLRLSRISNKDIQDNYRWFHGHFHLLDRLFVFLLLLLRSMIRLSFLCFLAVLSVI